MARGQKPVTCKSRWLWRPDRAAGSVFAVENSSSLADRQIDRVLRSLAHWCPYNKLQIEIRASSCPYGAWVTPATRHLLIYMGQPNEFPYLDDFTPRISWGRVATRPQALAGLLAHEFWHLRQYRQGRPLSELSADLAAVHALTCWRNGVRRRIPLYTVSG